MRQKGSHIVLKKETPTGPVGTVVPNHEELKAGTIREILRLAGITGEDFAELQ